MTLPNLSDWLRHDFTAKDLIALGSLGVLSWLTIKPFISLPTEPYIMASLPVQSKFSEHILEPFVLRSAWGHSGIGKASFEGENLIFQNYMDWDWLAARCPRVNSVSARWVWKDLGSSVMIPEVWCGYPWGIGRTAMIKFLNGEAYQVRVGLPDKFLCKVNTKEWVEMKVSADFQDGIFDLSINGYVFSLQMLDEPIGTADYVQIQFSLQGIGRVAIQEMSAE